MTTATTTGREAFLRLLINEGITHLFGNPGTTELALMQAVPAFEEIRYVLGLQEAVVLGMADGYARASGRPVAVNLHCAPGLGNAMGALYNAKFSGSPVIVTAGQYDIGYGLQEPLLYEPLIPIASPLVKWATEVQRLADFPRILHRAVKVALTPPTGPVFISLPGSVLDEEGELDLGQPTRVYSKARPTDGVLSALADRLLGAACPVLIAGREVAQHDCFAQVGELAELLGAAVYQEPVPYNARFPSSHPLCLGDLTRNQRAVHDALSAYDLLFCVGADLLRMSPPSPVDPLPQAMPVLHLSERDWELGKNYHTEMAVCADVRETLDALLPLLRARRTAGQAQAAERRAVQIRARNWSSHRDAAKERVLTLADTAPIEPDYLMMRLVAALPADAIVIEEALTATPSLTTFLPMADPHAFYGLASGGLGFGMAGAVGVSLAQPDRPVVAVIGDGSSLYSIQSLWSAAHLRLPITYVIVNNRSYRILKERLLAGRHTDRFVAMDFRDPPMDFVSIARGLGMPAQQVTRPEALQETLTRAMASGEPNLIEVIVADGFATREPVASRP